MSKCLRPTLSKNYLKPPLPCGRCISCVKTNKLQKSGSILLESDAQNKYSNSQHSFITLTYTEDNLPEHGSLKRSDITNFVKRFKINYKNHYGFRPIKYAYCGEYGSKTSRAHYHLIIFDILPHRCESITKLSWQLGISDIKPFENSASKYVAGYTLKKMQNNTLHPTKIPEFYRSSHSLGLSMLPTFIPTLLKHKLIPSRALTLLDKFIILNNPDKFSMFPNYSNEDNLFTGSFIRSQQGELSPTYIPILPKTSPETIDNILKSTPIYINKSTDYSPSIVNSSITLSENLQKKLFLLMYPDVNQTLIDLKQKLFEPYYPSKKQINKTMFNRRTINQKSKSKIFDNTITSSFNLETYVSNIFKTTNEDYKIFVLEHYKKLHFETLDFIKSDDKILLTKKLQKLARMIEKSDHAT